VAAIVSQEPCLPAPSRSQIFGREVESGSLNQVVTRTATEGAALVVRGSAGIGKTTLLASARENAVQRGMQVWKVSAASSEMTIPFAGLHQILLPMLEQVHELRHPHRDALLACFGMDYGPKIDALPVGNATLELLAAASEDAPVVLLIDDAHWLDQYTWDVLGFVSRRLQNMRVSIVVAIRDGYRTHLLDTIALPEIVVGPLDADSSERLLSSQSPQLEPQYCSRVLLEAAGNPLALVELSMQDLPGRPSFGRPARLPISARLQNALADRFLYLPPATQAILVVAALDEDAMVNEILEAASAIGEGFRPSEDDLAAAVEAGLVAITDYHIDFCHPLTAAAIYDTCTVRVRRRAHHALAAVRSIGEARRSWHRAAAATPPDDIAADELVFTAMNAKAAMRPAMMPEVFERAAALSSTTLLRQQRLLRAAEMALDLGETVQAKRLLLGVKPSDSGAINRARIRVLRDLTLSGVLRDPGAVGGLVDASIAAASDGDQFTAWRLLRTAAMRAWWADLGAPERNLISAAALKVSEDDEDPAMLSVLAAVDPGRCISALQRVTAQNPPAWCDPQSALAFGVALHMCGSLDQSSAYLSHAIPELKGGGYRGLLPEALALQAWNGIYVANLKEVAEAADEAIRFASEQRQPVWEAMGTATLALVCALRGDEAGAVQRLVDTETIAVPLGARAVLSDAQLARACLACSGGRYEEAFGYLERTFNAHDPVHHSLRSEARIGELAEAALFAGRTEEARAILDRLGSKWSFSTRAEVGRMYAQALLADDDATAEHHFEIALQVFDSDLKAWSLYRARFNLQYGMWLRRRRKVRQSREHLRAARDLFSALGATTLADRAGLELRASREQQHPRGTRLELTEQELEIAGLAARGLSNRAIGERLHISPRTVGSHLYKIFPKLGVATRSQLGVALSQSGSGLEANIA
jgi:DNA-binding CsgD family transcriptional regulator